MNRIIIIVSGLLFIFILFLFLSGGIISPEPPEARIKFMQSSISKARMNNAQEYAKKDFAESLRLYDSALQEWKTQNVKWIMKRDYDRLSSLIDRATVKAVKANKVAIQISGSLSVYVNQNITELTKRDELFRIKFNNLPLKAEIFNKHASAHLKLLEAVEARNRGNLTGSYNSLVEAESSFSYIESESLELIKTYFKSFKQWEKWYAETIKKSISDGSYAIVVDKMAHKCLLLKDGKILHQYNVELSQKWIGDKYHQGDNATPEGLYHITRKLDSRQTKFNKALLINYPNEEDKKRYNEGVRSGSIPKSVHIGGLIEIHGDGGKGKDWTNGCVALENKDMDHLYSMVSPGVPVTIVGSIVPLNRLFDN